MTITHHNKVFSQLEDTKITNFNKALLVHIYRCTYVHKQCNTSPVGYKKHTEIVLHIKIKLYFQDKFAKGSYELSRISFL